MPRRSAADTEQSREKIIASAGALMRAHGFDGIGIDAIVDRAGLTAGAFYRHFESKQALLEAVVERAVIEAAQHMPKLVDASDVATFVHAYVSQRKFKQMIAGCVIAAMAPDLARNGSPVRKAATSYVHHIHSALTRCLESIHGKRATAIAWQLMCAAIGGLVLSRLMGESAGDDIAEAVVSAAVASTQR
jgi:TetR/AcrR family transcriptional regulator, transcriptional repressor for nem operon